MITLAQAWAARLAELRATCRANGERLDAELRGWFERQHADSWWASFCEAAERGDEIPAAAWRSARVEGERRRMSGWVSRLEARNDAARKSGPPLKSGV